MNPVFWNGRLLSPVLLPACGLVLFLFCASLQASPFTSECDSTTRDFQPLTRDLKEKEKLTECKYTENAANSRHSRTGKNVCSSIYKVIRDSLKRFESGRKKGCLEVEKLMNSAGACNSRNSASQLKCIEMASGGFRLAAALENSSLKTLNDSIAQLSELEKEAESGLGKYQSDNRAMVQAFKNLEMEYIKAYEPGRIEELNRLKTSARAVSNNTLRSDITGTEGPLLVTGKNGGVDTIQAYRDAIPSLVEEQSMAKLFASQFRKLAKAARTKVQLRDTEFRQAADRNKEATQSSTESTVAFPLPMPASGISGGEQSEGIAPPSGFSGSEAGSARKSAAGTGFPTSSSGKTAGKTDKQESAEKQEARISRDRFALFVQEKEPEGGQEEDEAAEEKGFRSAGAPGSGPGGRAPGSRKFATISVPEMDFMQRKNEEEGVSSAGLERAGKEEGSEEEEALSEMAQDENPAGIQEEGPEDLAQTAGELFQGEREAGEDWHELSLFERVNRKLVRAEQDGWVASFP